MRSQPSDEDVNLSEVTRFNETIDQAIAEIVRRYAERTEHYGDVFLGILALEVRNPLNAIQLSAEELKSGPLRKAHSRSAERILKSVGTIDRMMDELSTCA